jgi:hypothetical protein
MAKIELVKVSGITTLAGVTKVCFSVDLVRRIKQWSAAGATRVDLVELPSEMTKLEALAYLKGHADFQSPSDQATIQDATDSRTPKAPRAPKAAKVVKVAKPKPSLEAIKARAKKVAVATPEVA